MITTVDYCMIIVKTRFGCKVNSSALTAVMVQWKKDIGALVPISF